MILLRPLVRLVTFVLLTVLALIGLAAAVSCIGSGEDVLSLAWLADLLRLHELRDSVATLLDRLESGDGSVPVVPALAGFGAVLLGLLLLLGLLVRTRERLVTLAGAEGGGRLAARRRPLGQIAAALVEQVRGVTATKAKVRPNRRTGGRLRITADRTRISQADGVVESSEEALAELTDAFKLRARVRTRLGESGARVQ